MQHETDGDRSRLDPEEGRRLVCAARDGDREARERLFALYAQPLAAWLQSRVGEKLARATSLSDLAQETYLQALAALRVLPDDAGLSGFEGVLFQHARWRVLKHADRNRGFEGESAADARGDVGSEPSEGLVTHGDQIEWVRGLIERLPPDQAAVVRRRLDGRPFADIARELGIPEDTARKRHLRGTLALQKLAIRSQDNSLPLSYPADTRQ